METWVIVLTYIQGFLAEWVPNGMDVLSPTCESLRMLEVMDRATSTAWVALVFRGRISWFLVIRSVVALPAPNRRFMPEVGYVSWVSNDYVLVDVAVDLHILSLHILQNFKVLLLEEIRGPLVRLRPHLCYSLLINDSPALLLLAAWPKVKLKVYVCWHLRCGLVE